jgi:hypothetical protein
MYFHNLLCLMLGQEYMIICNLHLRSQRKVKNCINLIYIEKKEVLDTILEPVSMMGLNLFKDE